MPPKFSVIIPFYNEASYLPGSLDSWLRQVRAPDELVVVDNGSSDDSLEVCRASLKRFTGTVRFASDDRPGKVNALETGCDVAKGDYLVFADADTFYPPQYLALAEELISESDDRIVAVMALGTGDHPKDLSERVKRAAYVLLSHVVKKQVFTGGFGQIIRSDVLAMAGGFSESYWPYVLLDHEVMQRVLKYGESAYHVDLWCIPSERRSDRSAVRWTLAERVIYHLTPFRFKDKFFYDFLGPRFEARGMTHLKLRERCWE